MCHRPILPGVEDVDVELLNTVYRYRPDDRARSRKPTPSRTAASPRHDRTVSRDRSARSRRSRCCWRAMRAPVSARSPSEARRDRGHGAGARQTAAKSAGLLRLEPIVDLASVGDGRRTGPHRPPARQMVFITMRCHARAVSTVCATRCWRCRMSRRCMTPTPRTGWSRSAWSKAWPTSPP